MPFFTYHNPVGINTVDDRFIDTCKLGVDKFLHVSSDLFGDFDLLLRVGQKSGNTINYGSQVQTPLHADPDAAQFGRCGYVQDDKGLVVYADGTNQWIYSFVVNVSALVPTVVTPHILVHAGPFDSDSNEEFWMPEINAGEFLLVYQVGAGIKGKRITVSGDTITVGNELSLITASHTLYQAIQLTTGKILILYFNQASSSILRAKIIHTITNTTFSAGTESQIDADMQYNPVAAASWDGVDAVLFGGEDNNTRLRIHPVTESSNNLTVHQLSYASYYSSITDGVSMAIALNNKGLLAVDLDTPTNEIRLFEFDYNTSTKAVTLSYNFRVLAPGTAGLNKLMKLSEELALYAWHYPGLSYNFAQFISTYSPSSSYFWGVWQDGLTLTYKSYDANLGAFSDVYLGTHVANDHVVVFSYYTQAPPFGSWYDRTFNLLTLTYNSYRVTASYALSYGATYSAVRYQRTYTNIRAIGFV